MNTLLDVMKFAGSANETRSLEPRAIFHIGELARNARRRWQEARIRNSVRDLERLDDRLLKDVGLFREHLPSGATLVRRR